MPQEFSAGAALFHRNKEIEYLLLHYKSGHWDFPKGHIEKGESREKTIRREVEEETGIKEIIIIPGFKETIKYFFRQYSPAEISEKKSLVKVDKITGRQNFKEILMNKEKFKQAKKPLWVFKMVEFYLAESKTKKVKISWEHTGYEWLSYEKAYERITYKNAKEILKKADEFLKVIK